MKKYLDKIICTRELEYLKAGKKSKIVINIGKPRKNKVLGRDYVCPVQILGIGSEKIQEANGFDSAQALYMAFHLAGVILLCHRRLSSGKISWLGEADLGFPFDPGLKKEPLNILKKRFGDSL